MFALKDFNHHVQLLNRLDYGLLAVSFYETPAIKAGEEYFKLFQLLSSSCEAVFGSGILQIPTYQSESGSMNGPTLACYNSIEPFCFFETEPHKDGSTLNEDV